MSDVTYQQVEAAVRFLLDEPRWTGLTAARVDLAEKFGANWAEDDRFRGMVYRALETEVREGRAVKGRHRASGYGTRREPCYARPEHAEAERRQKEHARAMEIQTRNAWALVWDRLNQLGYTPSSSVGEPVRLSLTMWADLLAHLERNKP